MDAPASIYFPRKGAQMLDAAIKSCGTQPDCIIEFLNKNYPFDHNGFLHVPIRLKTIENGKFVDYSK
jgi:hypothetical protein